MLDSSPKNTEAIFLPPSKVKLTVLERRGRKIAIGVAANDVRILKGDFFTNQRASHTQILEVRIPKQSAR